MCPRNVFIKVMAKLNINCNVIEGILCNRPSITTMEIMGYHLFLYWFTVSLFIFKVMRCFCSDQIFVYYVIIGHRWAATIPLTCVCDVVMLIQERVCADSDRWPIPFFHQFSTDKYNIMIIWFWFVWENIHSTTDSSLVNIHIHWLTRMFELIKPCIGLFESYKYNYTYWRCLWVNRDSIIKYGLMVCHLAESNADCWYKTGSPQVIAFR